MVVVEDHHALELGEAMKVGAMQQHDLWRPELLPPCEKGGTMFPKVGLGKILDRHSSRWQVGWVGISFNVPPFA